MYVGILQFDLLILGAESLKDKRRVVKSVKDRLHREHMVSVAEVGALDNMTVAYMGLACVSRDKGQIHRTLDNITHKLRRLTDAELGDVRREVIHGETGGDGGDETPEGAEHSRDPAETGWVPGEWTAAGDDLLAEVDAELQDESNDKPEHGDPRR